MVRRRAAPVRPRRDHDRQGLGAGYAPIGAVLCREEVYRAVAEGSRRSSWATPGTARRFPARSDSRSSATCASTGSSSACATRARGLREALAAALADSELVAEVRGRGFLLGIDYADPRDGRSFLPPELGLARRIDVEALSRGLVVYSTQPTRDGYAGDQTLSRARLHLLGRGALARRRADGRDRAGGRAEALPQLEGAPTAGRTA